MFRKLFDTGLGCYRIALEDLGIIIVLIVTYIYIIDYIISR